MIPSVECLGLMSSRAFIQDSVFHKLDSPDSRTYISLDPGPWTLDPMKKLAPDWKNIDTVLLDMDGTLLDKYFDDHFWEEYVPSQYALANGISEDQAKEDLMPRYRSREETLDWADLDFLSG